MTDTNDGGRKHTHTRVRIYTAWDMNVKPQYQHSTMSRIETGVTLHDSLATAARPASLLLNPPGYETNWTPNLLHGERNVA